MIRPVIASVAAIAAFSCTLAGGFEYASAPRAASSERKVTVFIDRTNKGDRLNAAALPTSGSDRSSSGTPAPASRNTPPLGCDPLFSSIADPRQARIFGRCAT